jgi:ribosomal protein S18 acetylase RimI-like enzyme
MNTTIMSLHHMNLGNVFVKKGLTESLIAQLISFATTDPALQSTSDPKRFKDRDAFNEWLQKKREVYVLTNESDELLGIIWFGAKELPEKAEIQNVYRQSHGITFSIRIFAKARGQHLAKPFSQAVFAHYRNSSSYIDLNNNGIWLETDSDNAPALHLYKQLGFEQIGINKENNRLLMTQTTQKI